MMIHIGWDAKRAFQNTTGLGNYSRDTIKMMVEFFPENKYSLYTPNLKRAIQSPFYKFTKEQDLNIVSAPSKLLAAGWRTKGIVKDLVKDKIQIYHGLSNEIPLGLHDKNIRTVVSIHDLIFKHYPSYYKRIDRSIYHQKVQYACKNADLILAMSECTKRDLIHYYQVPDQKIKVQYQSVHPIFNTTAEEKERVRIKTQYTLPDAFCLMVSAFEQRKNHAIVLEALARLNNPDIHLVLVGRPRDTYDAVKNQIQKLGINQQVTILTDVDLNTLNILYDLANLFIQPSLYEGFGIPVLEALTKGLPSLLADNSSFPEIAKEAALYFNPKDANSLKEQWEQLWDNHNLQTTLKNNIQIETFQPQILSQELMSHYQNIL